MQSSPVFQGLLVKQIGYLLLHSVTVARVLAITTK